MNTLKKMIFLLLVGMIFVTNLQSQLTSNRATPSILNKYDAQIDEIISNMTLEEKLGMFYGIRMFSSAGVPRLGIADFEFADGPFGIREELEANSWSPAGLGNDLATFFPTGSALAATWNPDIAYKYGVAIGAEGRLRGKDMLLGPAINIQRLPVGGRTYEYFSEDPFLSARLSVGYTKGVQSVGLAVCLKHFALNNQENNRGRVDVKVSQRAMREIYLPPFESAVKEADAWGVMAAYNKVNGFWCSENEILQEKILRDEWGFRGLIVSDWGGTHSTVNAIKNGLDIEMPNGMFLGKALVDSVKSGAVSIDVINKRVKDILRVRLHVKPVPASEANKTLTSQVSQQRTAYEVATKSIVLLKNENSLLPLDLKKYKSIAIIGDNAQQKNATGGVGAGVKTLYEITPYQGLRDRLGNTLKVTYARGYKSFSFFGNGPFQFGQPLPSPYVPADTALLNEAVRVAQAADLVLFVGGTNREVETEGSDRTSIQLPSGQDEVIKAIAAVNPNIVTVIVSGGPVDLNTINQYSSSIVMSWFNGSEGGHALADILLGKLAPVGHLPFTMPVKLEDSPAFALGNYPQAGGGFGPDVFVNLVDGNQSAIAVEDRNIAKYSEELLVGYRWFDTKKIKPLFPFGHGLTYTDFEYANLKATQEKYSLNETLKVSVDVKNTGKYEADELVQLYVHRVKSKIFYPEKELKAFAHVPLKAGETTTVTLDVPVFSLRYWDEKKNEWVLEKGKIEILVGASSGDIRQTTGIEIVK
ncbi:MAG: glycoside hydrolase family 3 C-terminal domain-containing protein [Candidatus Symbiothrix sp.]|jgi:beta-glucosidase|nr:glycoside hydrolase family 3 C-terminal domain-containing protein [Candidatus Symbiothrix sp.]